MAAKRWRCTIIAGCYAVALVELVLGVVAGNFVGVPTRPWLDSLAGFASIVLTFLAGATVDPELLRAIF